MINVYQVIPYAPCMEYSPTFAVTDHPSIGTVNNGKYTIHGASGYYIPTVNIQKYNGK